MILIIQYAPIIALNSTKHGDGRGIGVILVTITIFILIIKFIRRRK